MTVSDALVHLCLEDYPDDQAIRARYREYAAILHPDRHRNKVAAGLLMRKCNEARESLLKAPIRMRKRKDASKSESDTTHVYGSAGEVIIDAAELLAGELVRGNRRVLAFAAGVAIAGVVALFMTE